MKYLRRITRTAILLPAVWMSASFMADRISNGGMTHATSSFASGTAAVLDLDSRLDGFSFLHACLPAKGPPAAGH